jgi:hypothetical protein
MKNTKLFLFASAIAVSSLYGSAFATDISVAGSGGAIACPDGSVQLCPQPNGTCATIHTPNSVVNPGDPITVNDFVHPIWPAIFNEWGGGGFSGANVTPD